MADDISKFPIIRIFRTWFEPPNDFGIALFSDWESDSQDAYTDLDAWEIGQWLGGN